MIPNNIKKILAGVMIFFDFLIACVFGSLFLEEGESVYMFLLIVTLIDSLLTVDYISTLNKQDKALMAQEAEENVARIRHQIRQSSLYDKEREMDRQMANEIRNNPHSNVYDDPEELQELLQNKDNQNQNLHG